MADSVVIIPTYNKKENIENIIRKVFSLEKAFDILIVEDNSPDGTADIVKRLMQEFPGRLFIKERKGKLGLGTAYFSDTGVMVFKNSLDGKTLLVRIVNNETVRGYVEGIEHIKGMGYSVQAIVADGRRGIFNAFKDIPVQLCHFHQVKTVTKYLTKRPKLEASKELRQLSLLLKCSDRRSFENSLDVWYAKWHETLDERTFFEKDGQERSTYTHMNLRKAYRSLRRNMPHLFVFEEWRELNIPNTTNCLDGHFSDLKNKLRNHNGLSRRRKVKMIMEYFST